MPQNGSKNDLMAPRTTLECPHEGPYVGCDGGVVVESVIAGGLVVCGMPVKPPICWQVHGEDGPLCPYAVAYRRADGVLCGWRRTHCAALLDRYHRIQTGAPALDAIPAERQGDNLKGFKATAGIWP